MAHDSKENGSPGNRSMETRSMVITEDQEKLLLNATRIRILRALQNTALTAKQVADKLGGSKGNVHYHVQRLFEAGFLDLVETHEAAGILEKYYRAKAAIYTRGQTSDGSPPGEVEWTQLDPNDTVVRMATRLMLTSQQLGQFHADVVALMERWEESTIRVNDEETHEYVVDVSISGQSEERK